MSRDHRRPPDWPPPFYLRNCYVIVRPYGWLSYAGLAAELYELDADVYEDISPALAGYWLVWLGVPTTWRRSEDDEEIPGVAFADIAAEIEQRRQRAARRRAIRKLTRT